MVEVNYLMTMSTWPQASWSLRTVGVNPCDATLLPHHQPENCAQADLRLTPLPQLVLKNPLPKLCGIFRLFRL